MPKVPYPYEVNGKFVTGNGSLIRICSISNRSLLPSVTVIIHSRKWFSSGKFRKLYEQNTISLGSDRKYGLLHCLQVDCYLDNVPMSEFESKEASGRAGNCCKVAHNFHGCPQARNSGEIDGTHHIAHVLMVGLKAPHVFTKT